MGVQHRSLTGKNAVHPFAYVQATDPALVGENAVGPYKAWIDTSTGNTLKIRNSSNTAWDIVQAGSGQTTAGFSLLNVVHTLDEFPFSDQGDSALHLINYL